ncbi:hypothetical protein SAMD00019534_075510 [Acytostelium subglobosum LB1]|uniref:hypothetical protein n=1 Tax=Acytostelium subglobosum LB1 TaxID=1410327 RepID=UPI00064481FA|nr:hypothetical protein SAMD00019534_075510 [Acytostelium subglobosum LB1]GAM24376.1 hypothetical protein SAMD00019534_075510 [Acytostelium subglobosum LB1]|eukprot:XP_012752702.1 hypothetical protein SAMD00019534_075510 [Acytostelium subglobosum LB1]
MLSFRTATSLLTSRVSTMRFTRLYSSSAVANNDSSYLESLNKPNLTKKSLDEVFAKVNQVVGAPVYDTLIQRYNALGEVMACVSVANFAKINNITLSESSYDIIQEHVEDKNVKQEDDTDFSKLNHIYDDFLKYKEANTRRPWLNQPRS